MSFWVLAPEINSARMYAGAGVSPWLEAANGWTALSTGLTDTAAAFNSVLSGLATAWMGPSAVLMSQAAQRYQAWLTTTALAAERTAQQALAAAAAYEAAFVAMVPPAEIAANRTLLTVLVATNVLGQNTAAIAATEARYAEMWAQDIAAMAGYQSASQEAAALPTFAPAPQITSPVITTAAPVITSGGVQSILNSLADPTSPLGLLNQYMLAAVSSGFWYEVPLQIVGLFSSMWAVSSAAGPLSALEHGSPVAVPNATPAPSTTVTSAPSIRAATGTAKSIGLLRVPAAWARLPTTSGATHWEVPLAVAEDTLATPMPTPMPLMATGGQRQRQDPEYGQRPTIMQRHPYGG